MQYLRTGHTSRNANIFYTYPFHTIIVFYQEGVQSVGFRIGTLQRSCSLFTRNCYNIGLQPDLILTPIHSPKEIQGEIQNLPICSIRSADGCRARRGTGHRDYSIPMTLAVPMIPTESRTGQEALKSNTVRPSALLDPTSHSVHFHIENQHNTRQSIPPSRKSTSLQKCILISRQT